ncbi:glutathione S-transferase [Microstroma glucosiphilum]|uniref:Glutathione S-transferase n=1 Tax=Pseudomicrostroma glucosiphilum TaxID=1684307 RepID=A0A316UBL9_9BASI|nr:glutathione S-transferase [Pseudomicrostroma glucosiphilum]PWN22627.1 glutathione S-transferase [Pseudomicrostroma glucosiphilum]
MAQFTLYSHRGPGPNPLKVAIVLEKLGLSYEVVALDFGDDHEKGVKGKFLQLNPNGRVPALVDHQQNDFVVWESGAILFYLAAQYDKQGKFFGKDVQEQTITMQWLTHQLSGLGPVQGNVNFLHHYWKGAYGEEPQKSAFTRFEGETHRLYKILDDQLARQSSRGSQYIALDRPTIADYSFYAWVNIASFGKVDISPYTHVVKWLETINADPQIKAADDKLPKS